MPFVEVAADVGLDFHHFNGMSGEYYFAEMMGAGAALFDADGDGDLDAYLVQGRMLGDKGMAEALLPPQHPLPLTDRLYRNELIPSGVLRFTDVTEASGLEVATGYGMGVAAGDADNDGDVDLYLTNFGSNQLLRNDSAAGRVAFTDVTLAAGVDDPRWSVAALFFDADADGRLDLYVGNYVDFRLGTHKRCFDAAGAQDYCAPAAYRGEPDRLFRNVSHDGRIAFEDVSLVSGVGTLAAPGLGALAADLDSGGRLDLYVANDGEPNFLWLSRGEPGSPLRFEESALFAGCAVDEEGRPQASMGVALGDADGDSDDDLFMSHLTGETNALFAGNGKGHFRDATAGSGLGQPSLPATGFGTSLFDYDNDGWLDLAVVNGAVKTVEELAAAGDPYPLHQRNLLVRNTGDGRFDDVTDRAGAAFELSEVSRGAAFGDVDNDGDVDVLVANNAGPARLLLNQAGSARGWIGLRLLTADPGRDALGARVEVIRPGLPPLRRRSHTDGSYASASDPRVVIGLGDDEGVVDVRVAWPDGTVESWTSLATRRYHTLHQGSRLP